MATAATLEQAAGQAYANLSTKWASNLLKSRLTQFWQASIGPTADVFPEQNANSRPVANWMTVIAAISSLLPATDVPIEQLSESATAVYKVCWLAFVLNGQGLVTNAQATALLAAYNAAF